MKKTIVARLALLFLAILTLSGCLLIPVGDGYYDDFRGRDHGRHRGDRYR